MSHARNASESEEGPAGRLAASKRHTPERGRPSVGSRGRPRGVLHSSHCPCGLATPGLLRRRRHGVWRSCLQGAFAALTSPASRTPESLEASQTGAVGREVAAQGRKWPWALCPGPRPAGSSPVSARQIRQASLRILETVLSLSSLVSLSTWLDTPVDNHTLRSGARLLLDGVASSRRPVPLRSPAPVHSYPEPIQLREHSSRTTVRGGPAACRVGVSGKLGSAPRCRPGLGCFPAV